MAIKLSFVVFLLISGALLNKTYAQTNKPISMSEIHIPGLFNIGTYSQLISAHGLPKTSFVTTMNPVMHKKIDEDKRKVSASALECTHLIYEAFEYVRIKDSVQLVFVDFTKADISLFLRGYEFDKHTNQEFFLKSLIRMGLWSEEHGDIYIGLIESHYCSNARVKCYGVGFEEDPYSSIVLAFHDKCYNRKIWWIEIPIMRVNGIVH